MDEGVQCSCTGFSNEQKDFFGKLEDRIIESQKQMFVETGKIIESQSKMIKSQSELMKSQNEKLDEIKSQSAMIESQRDMIKSQNDMIAKLNKQVEVHSETIGTLDARLEIIYRFLNKEIKDLEGKMWVKLDSIVSFLAHQFYFSNNHSLPQALIPILGSLTDIRHSLQIISGQENSGRNLVAASEEVVTNNNSLSEAVLNDIDIEDVIKPGGDEITVIGVKQPFPSRNLPNHCEISHEHPEECISDDSAQNTVKSRNPGLPSGSKLLIQSSGIQNTPGLDMQSLIERQTNLKRKLNESQEQKEGCDNVNVSIEEGEILDEGIDVPRPPIGRISVRTTGIFKDVTMEPKRKKCK